MPPTARSIVTQRIASLYKKFPDFEFTPLLVDGLTERDAALARAIDHAILRRWLSLTTLIDHATDRNVRQLDSTVGATLLVAAAQLMLMDRIPDHAIIHNAVEWLKTESKHSRATGFVNAVLRKIVKLRGKLVSKYDLNNPAHFIRKDGTAFELTVSIFKEGIGQQAGFESPSWSLLCSTLGEEKARHIALNSLVEAPKIVTIPQGMFLPEGITPHSKPLCGILENNIDIALLLKKYPNARIQDPTPMESLEICKMLRPKRILDVCAGRGTKTKQLRSMFPDAFIGATEPNDKRRESLCSISKELGITVYQQGVSGPNEPFDLVVVDVPCSNSGVFARRPEAKYRYKQNKIDSLVALQREILNDSFQILHERGHLIYTTCSIDHRENEEQKNWLIKNKKLKCISSMLTLPNNTPGECPSNWHDGGFSAMFCRV
mgnify:CR=1 FL=1